MYLKKNKKIGILGAGAFGTALAISYSQTSEVYLFSCFNEHIESMKNSRINEFFQEFKIPNNIEIKNIKDIEQNKFDYFLWCFPIKPSINILRNIKNIINGIPVIICSKGILPDNRFMSNLFEDALNDSKIGYLSGPNFATELAENKMSAADIASQNIDDARIFSNDLSHDLFRLNPIDDMIGIQVAGAVKNIIAIACGIANGLNLGQNAHAAIVTLAVAEMKNLGVKLGSKESTFYGFCGVGDLVLTTSSESSRNMAFGKKIAAGERTEDIMKSNISVVEGFETISQIIALAEKNSVDLPICKAVYKILFEKTTPETILNVFK